MLRGSSSSIGSETAKAGLTSAASDSESPIGASRSSRSSSVIRSSAGWSSVR